MGSLGSAMPYRIFLAEYTSLERRILEAHIFFERGPAMYQVKVFTMSGLWSLGAVQNVVDPPKNFFTYLRTSVNRTATINEIDVTTLMKLVDCYVGDAPSQASEWLKEVGLVFEKPKLDMTREAIWDL